MKFIDASGVDFDTPVRFNSTMTATGAVDLSAATSITGSEVVLTISEIGLLGSAVHYVVSPYAGTIVKIWSVLNSEALATGNATLTASIAGVAVTNGAITITQAASAVGDVDSATPTALNIVTAGQAIAVTLGGSNSAEGAYANVSIVIRRSA